MPVDVCIVCLSQSRSTKNSVEVDNVAQGMEATFEPGIFKKFLRFATNYLSIPSNIGIETNERKQFCNNCQVVVKGVCELYSELMTVKLRLSWKLGELSNLLDISKSSVSDQLGHLLTQIIADQLNIDELPQVDQFRSLLKTKCTDKYEQTLPQIALERQRQEALQNVGENYEYVVDLVPAIPPKPEQNEVELFNIEEEIENEEEQILMPHGISEEEPDQFTSVSSNETEKPRDEEEINEAQSEAPGNEEGTLEEEKTYDLDVPSKTKSCNKRRTTVARSKRLRPKLTRSTTSTTPKPKNETSSRFKCSEPECKSAYKYLDDLRYHHKLKHSGRPPVIYKCDDCWCQYTKKSSLNVHRKLKHGVMENARRPRGTGSHKCVHCGRGGSAPKNVYLHIRRFHKNVKDEDIECCCGKQSHKKK